MTNGNGILKIVLTVAIVVPVASAIVFKEDVTRSFTHDASPCSIERKSKMKCVQIHFEPGDVLVVSTGNDGEYWAIRDDEILSDRTLWYTDIDDDKLGFFASLGNVVFSRDLTVARIFSHTNPIQNWQADGLHMKSKNFRNNLSYFEGLANGKMIDRSQGFDDGVAFNKALENAINDFNFYNTNFDEKWPEPATAQEIENNHHVTVFFPSFTRVCDTSISTQIPNEDDNKVVNDYMKKLRELLAPVSGNYLPFADNDVKISIEGLRTVLHASNESTWVDDEGMPILIDNVCMINSQIKLRGNARFSDHADNLDDQPIAPPLELDHVNTALQIKIDQYTPDAKLSDYVIYGETPNPDRGLGIWRETENFYLQAMEFIPNELELNSQ